MANELKLILSLNDGLSKGLAAAQEKLKKFGDELKRVGGDINQVGSTMTQFGAAMTGPFVLALNNAAKSSTAVRSELNKLSSVTNAFQRDIAQSVLPVVEKFTSLIYRLYQSFQSVPEALRNSTAQAILLGGAFLTISGILTALVGKITQTAGAILSIGSSILALAVANPILVSIAIAIGSILVLMYKFENVTKFVANAFEIVARASKIHLTAVITNLQAVQLKALEVAITIADAFSKLPSVLGFVFGSLEEDLRKTGQAINILRNESLLKIQDDVVALDNLLKGNSGEWANGFTGARDEIQGLITDIQTLIGGISGGEVPQEIINWQEQFKQLGEQLLGSNETIAGSFEKIKGSIQQMRDGFANAIGQMIVQGNDFKTIMIGVFQQFASAAIAEITKVILRMETLKKVKGLFGGLFGGVGGFLSSFFHDGGMIYHNGGPIRKAHEGLAVDEVPIIAQTGEGILSRKGMQALGGAGVLNALNQGQGIGGSTSINIYIGSATMSSQQSISDTAETLGFEIERALRRSRGI